MKYIHIDNVNDIPVISSVDVLILGGSLSGVSAACYAAKHDMKVLLVESGTFLGLEITQWQRPWIKWSTKGKEIIKQYFQADEAGKDLVDGDIIPLNMDRFKVHLEEKLKEYEVDLLYASQAIRCTKEDETWYVTLGNKSGRQIIKAKFVIDATETSITRFLVDEISSKKNTDYGTIYYDGDSDYTIVRRTIEFTGLDPDYKCSYTVPSFYKVYNNTVDIYKGAFSSDHVYVDIPVIVPFMHENSIKDDLKVEVLVRRTSLEVASFLVNNIPAFSKAVIGFGSLRAMKMNDIDPVNYIEKGIEIGKKLVKNDITNCFLIVHDENKILKDCIDTEHKICKKATYCELNDFIKLYNYPSQACLVDKIPIFSETDVLVVGGGTSGATAARTSAQEKVKTALVEMNSALGGTGTLGGVNIYWFGRDNSFSDEIDLRVKQWSNKLNCPSGFYIWGNSDIWSIELKAYTLLEMCLENEVEVFLDCITIGTLVEENKVTGVVIASPYGMGCVISKVTIDATGDGDIAAFASSNYKYGNDRDYLTMWASLAQYTSPCVHQNNFSSTVDVSNIFDYTRMILLSRKRGGRLHDHGSYLAPRESRHITGNTILTLSDQLLMRHFPDTVAICYSNHDPKGKSMADLIYFGILPPHLEIEIPYSALIPQGLEQLIVIGKALSCTHDALPAIRMQRDLQQLGGAMGIAAALGVKSQTRQHEINLKELQRLLVDRGDLPERVLSQDISKPRPPLDVIIDKLTGNEDFQWLDMGFIEMAVEVSPVILICLTEASEVIPLLMKEFEKSTGNRRLLIARLLLWHGNVKGLQEVIDEIKMHLKCSYPLPGRNGSIRFTQLLPDHGIMTETNNLINALSKVKDKRVLEIYSSVVDRICKASRDYNDIRAGMYNYIESVAYAAERLVFPEFIPLLERLQDLPELKRQLEYEKNDTNILEERLTYLMLSLCRASARCGSKKGLLKLVEFLTDKRSLVILSAYKELVAITGMDFKLNYVIWKAEINLLPAKFGSVPWTLKIE